MPQGPGPRSGPRTQSRPGRHAPSHGGPSPRVLLAGALVLATLAGGYWFVLRGDDGSSAEFLQSERKVATAGQQVLEAGSQVQRFLQLERFNVAVDAQLPIVETETKKLRAMAADFEGSEATITRNAVSAATRVATASVSYRDALNRSDIADAQAARVDLETSIKRLEAQARAWKNL